jgi:hypothetical protein
MFVNRTKGVETLMNESRNRVYGKGNIILFSSIINC